MKMMNKLKKYTPRINAVKVVTGTGLMSLAISANAALLMMLKMPFLLRKLTV